MIIKNIQRRQSRSDLVLFKRIWVWAVVLQGLPWRRGKVTVPARPAISPSQVAPVPVPPFPILQIHLRFLSFPTVMPSLIADGGVRIWFTGLKSTFHSFGDGSGSGCHSLGGGVSVFIWILFRRYQFRSDPNSASIPSILAGLSMVGFLSGNRGAFPPGASQPNGQYCTTEDNAAAADIDISDTADANSASAIFSDLMDSVPSCSYPDKSEFRFRPISSNFRLLDDSDAVIQLLARASAAVVVDRPVWPGLGRD